MNEKYSGKLKVSTFMSQFEKQKTTSKEKQLYRKLYIRIWGNEYSELLLGRPGRRPGNVKAGGSSSSSSKPKIASHRGPGSI